MHRKQEKFFAKKSNILNPNFDKTIIRSFFLLIYVEFFIIFLSVFFNSPFTAKSLLTFCLKNFKIMFIFYRN